MSKDIIEKAIRNRKDSSVKGSTMFSAFLENRKLNPKIIEVSIAANIGKIFSFRDIKSPPYINNLKTRYYIEYILYQKYSLCKSISYNLQKLTYFSLLESTALENLLSKTVLS